jgi:hypothetical protein
MVAIMNMNRISEITIPMNKHCSVSSRYILLLLICWLHIPVTTFAFSSKDLQNRSKFISSLTTGMLIVPLTAFAKAPTAEEDIGFIQEASSTLTILLENWEKATVECIFADIPRELLEQKNKQELLEKASTFALFDKSTSVVSCKTTNKTVRDYIGVTGKGPLVNIEKRMLRKSVVDTLDVDDLELYFTQVENFQRAISRASTATYAAGVADFDSIVNFEKGNPKGGSDSNLNQAKSAIQEASHNLEEIVSLLTMMAK